MVILYAWSEPSVPACKQRTGQPSGQQAGPGQLCTEQQARTGRGGMTAGVQASLTAGHGVEQGFTQIFSCTLKPPRETFFFRSVCFLKSSPCTIQNLPCARIPVYKVARRSSPLSAGGHARRARKARRLLPGQIG